MVIHDDCLHAWYFHSELVDRCRDPRNPIISNPIQFQYDWGVTNSPCYWHLQSFTCYPKRIWLTWSPRLWITWKTDATFMRFFGALKDWDEDFDLVPRTNKYPEIDDGKICRRLFIWQKPLLPTEFLLNPWQCTQLRSVRVASYLYALSRVQESAERKHSLRHLGYRGRWANPMGFHPLESWRKDLPSGYLTLLWKVAHW